MDNENLELGSDISYLITFGDNVVVKKNFVGVKLVDYDSSSVIRCESNNLELCCFHENIFVNHAAEF